MNRCVCLAGQVREKIIRFSLSDEIGELIISPVDHPFTDKSPFADMNPLIRTVHALVCKRIPVDDNFGKKKLNALNAFRFAFRLEQSGVLLSEIVQKPFATSLGVVGKQFYPIDA